MNDETAFKTEFCGLQISLSADLEKLLTEDVFLVHVSFQKYKWLSPEDKHNYFIFFSPEEAVGLARNNFSEKDSQKEKSLVFRTKYVFKPDKIKSVMPESIYSS